jgi:prolipoprotein diacylglyceryltransferase
MTSPLTVAVTATAWLDERLRGLPRVYVARGRLRLPAFLACGLCGYALAVTVAVALAEADGRSGWTILAMAGAAAVTFFAVAMTTKVLTGEETLTFLNHAVAVIVVVSAGLAMTDMPVMPYVDVTAIALLVFLACGRVGCFLVGCCHGRPHDWGVRYTAEHVDEGFPAHLAGVPVVPVPLLEAGADLVIAAVAASGVLGGWRSGVPTAVAVLLYAGVRVLLEQWRGDPRHGVLGLSTGQWSSAAAAVVVAVVAMSQGDPARGAWVAGAALVVAVVVTIAVRNEFGRALAFRVDRPTHLAELARLLRDLDDPDDEPGRVVVGTTSVGVRVTHGGGQYACSTPQPLVDWAAARLGKRIVQLHHPSSWYRVLRSDAGVLHVLVFSDDDDPPLTSSPSGLVALLDRLSPEAARSLLASLQQSHGNAAVLQALAAKDAAPGLKMADRLSG